MVKKGAYLRSSFGSFNLKNKRKIADNDFFYSDEDDQPVGYGIRQSVDPGAVDPGAVEEDETTRLMQELEKKKQEQKVKKIPSTGVDPKEINQRLDEWIVNNKQQILTENEQDTLVLIDKRDSHPQDSYLDKDVTLYKLLSQYPKYKAEFSKKILQYNPVVEPENANIFVDTMMAKTKNILDEQADIAEQEKTIDISEASPPEEQPDGGRMQTQMMVQSLFDPNSLTPEEKSNIMGVLGFDKMYDERQLSNAIVSSFNAESNIDPRFNFFLKNPKLLDSIFSKHPGLSGVLLRTSMDKSGIAGSDVYASLQQAYKGGAITQRPMIDLLSAEPHGRDILEKLENLISSKDLSIVDWFKDGLRSKMKEYTPSIYGQEEDMPRGGIEDVRPLQQRQPTELEKAYMKKQKSMTDLSKKMASVVLYYLADDLNNMKALHQNSTVRAMQEYNSRGKRIKEQIAQDPGDRSLKSALRASESDYAHADEMNAFIIAAQKQLVDVFNELGTSKRQLNNPNMMIYKNGLGSVKIPTAVLKDIFGDTALKPGQDPETLIKQYKGAVDKYKDKIKNRQVVDPYKPDWKFMVNNRLSYRAYADFGELKHFIREKAQGKVDKVFNVYNEIMSFPKMRKKLQAFSGVNLKKELEAGAEQKMMDYISTTIGQNSKNVEYAIDVFKMKEKYDGQRSRFPPKRYDPKNENFKALISSGEMRTSEQEEEVKEINKKEDRHTINLAGRSGVKTSLLHSIKTHIGDNMEYILPYLTNMVESGFLTTSEDKEHMRAFVDLIDHNPVKLANFYGRGRERNKRDRSNRYNTELYHIAKQMPLPQHVSDLINIYKQWEASSPHKTLKGGWFGDLFNLYDEYNKRYRAALTQKDYIQNRNGMIAEQQKNTIIPKVLEVVKAKTDAKNNFKQWHKILDRVPEEEKSMFESMVSFWDMQPIDDKPPFPSKYLPYLGLLGLSKSLIKLEKQRDAYRDKLEKYKKSVEKKEEIIEKKLMEKGYKIDLPALGRASAAYRKAMKRIETLQNIQKNGMKFASFNKNVISKVIKREEQNFYNLFDRLFR